MYINTNILTDKCSYSVADLHSKILDPPGPIFFIFHAFFGKMWPNNRLTPPWDWRPLRNPGSAADSISLQIITNQSRHIIFVQPKIDRRGPNLFNLSLQFMLIDTIGNNIKLICSGGST